MRSFFRWIWATYQTLTLWQWLIALPLYGGGVSTVPLLGALYNWPIWLQAFASGVAAFMWLALSTWIINLFKRKPESGPTGISDSPHAQQAKDVQGGVSQVEQTGDRNINVGDVGGDLIIGERQETDVKHNTYEPTNPDPHKVIGSLFFENVELSVVRRGGGAYKDFPNGSDTLIWATGELGVIGPAMFVEQIDLEMNGRATPALNWKGLKVDRFRGLSLYFNVPNWANAGEHTARLLAWANKLPFSSEDLRIVLPS